MLKLVLGCCRLVLTLILVPCALSETIEVGTCAWVSWPRVSEVIEVYRSQFNKFENFKNFLFLNYDFKRSETIVFE